MLTVTLCTFSSLQKAYCNLSDGECHCWEENLGLFKSKLFASVAAQLWGVLLVYGHPRAFVGWLMRGLGSNWNKQDVLLGQMNERGFSCECQPQGALQAWPPA